VSSSKDKEGGTRGKPPRSPQPPGKSRAKEAKAKPPKLPDLAAGGHHKDDPATMTKPSSSDQASAPAVSSDVPTQTPHPSCSDKHPPCGTIPLLEEKHLSDTKKDILWDMTPDLWERQPHDTDKSFYCFNKYYLSQPPPRSLKTAYFAWRREHSSAASDITINGNTPSTPQQWTRWANARTHSGIIIEGAKTWRQRVTAFDAHVNQLEITKWVNRQLKIRDLDFDQGNALRDLATLILERGPDFIKRTVSEKVLQDGTIQRDVKLALDGNLAVRCLEAASKLQRLAAEMHTDSSKLSVESVSDFINALTSKDNDRTTNQE